ncbi:FKBP12-interacting protein of 37 kDa [Tanacetum coccineum]
MSTQARRLLLDPAIHEEVTQLKVYRILDDSSVESARDHYFRALDVRRNAIEDSFKAPCQSLLEEKDEKILDLEANDQAINFTSHSKMGKMLMAKCRTLQEESLDFIYMVVMIFNNG